MHVGPSETGNAYSGTSCGNDTAMDQNENDPVLEQFTDDDKHVASRRLLDDIDDRVESEYPGSEFVYVSARSRAGHPSEASE